MENSWKTNFNLRITASVRSTNRLNLMLNDTLATKSKAFTKNKSMENIEESIEEEDESKVKVEYFKTNFSMEQVRGFSCLVCKLCSAWES